MDELEKYIVEHKELLNKAVPSSKVWANIESSIEDSALKTSITASEVENQAPSPKVWVGIESSLAQERSQEKQSKEVKMVPLRRVWQLAASFTILLVSVVWLQYYLQQADKSGSQIVASYQESTLGVLEKNVPELVEAEQYYMSVIYQKEASLRQYAIEDYSHSNLEFEVDMEHLDSVYQQMKEGLASQPSNERIVNAMIENLQLRMNILSRQLELMEQLKQIKEGRRETIDLPIFES